MDKLWILHAMKGTVDEAVIILDAERLEDIGLDPEGEVGVADVAAEYLGYGWVAEGLLEVEAPHQRIYTLPLGELMVRYT